MPRWYNAAMSQLQVRLRVMGVLALLAFISVACSAATSGSSQTPEPTLVLTPYRTATQTVQPTSQASQPLASSTPRPSPTPLTHIVTAGQTLLGIAERYGVSLDVLLAANPGVDARFLSVGMEISVPASSETEAESLATPTALPLEVSTPVCYSSAAGELWCFLLVENDRAEPVENLSGRIDLLSADGSLLASGEATPPLNILSAGEAMPLVAYWAEAPEGWVKTQGQLLGAYKVLNLEARYLQTTLSTEDVSIAPSALSAQVQGGIVVSGEDTPALIWVLAVAYDEEGTVVGLRRWEKDGPANEFDLWVYSLGPEIKRVDLLVEARP